MSLGRKACPTVPLLMLLALLLNASALFSAVVAALVANVSAVLCALFAAVVANVSAVLWALFAALVANVSAVLWALFAALVANVSAVLWALFAAVVANVSAVLNVLLFAAVTSELNASICVAPLLSWNCRCGSVPSSHTSPVTGLLGAAVPLGMFNEAYPVADCASACLPPV